MSENQLIICLPRWKSRQIPKPLVHAFSNCYYSYQDSSRLTRIHTSFDVSINAIESKLSISSTTSTNTRYQMKAESGGLLAGITGMSYELLIVKHKQSYLSIIPFPQYFSYPYFDDLFFNSMPQDHDFQPLCQFLLSVTNSQSDNTKFTLTRPNDPDGWPARTIVEPVYLHRPMHMRNFAKA